MFDHTLLECSLRRTSVLGRIHYLFSAFVGSFIFGVGLCVLPVLLAGRSPRFVAPGIVGCAAGLYALMLCYVRADARQQGRRAWPWIVVMLLFNLPGFLIYLIYSARKSGDWKRAAMPLAYVAESTCVGVLVLVPLIYTQALPRQWLTTGLYVPAPPPGPPPTQPKGRPAPLSPHATVDPYTAPPIIPAVITEIVETLQPSRDDVGVGTGVIGSLPIGSSSASLDPVLGSLLGGKETPPPPIVHPTPNQQIARMGGDVMEARALYQPKPVYPPLAIMAHIQGTVVLQAILSKDGTVQNLEVLSGHPLLVHAAIDAVRTWRYQPTLLNSEPVEVLTEIHVNFNLGE